MAERAAAIYPDLQRFQVDLSGRFIRLLERLGLATEVKRPSENQIARKRVVVTTSKEAVARLAP